MPENKEQEAYVRKPLLPNAYSIIVILLSIPSTGLYYQNKLINALTTWIGVCLISADSHKAGQEISCLLWTDRVKGTCSE